ncbi:MAG: hypothetical protein WCQ53_06580 [bacterium]
MKKLFLIIFLISFAGYAAEEEKKPIKLETKLKNETTQDATKTFTPVDNSEKFKANTKDATEVSNMDIKSIQEKVDAIRNRVLDAKSKLIETTKDEVIAKTPLSYLVIEHKNNMSSRFSILSLTYILDGKRVYSDYDLYRIKKDSYPVYNSFIAPGHHEVFVEMVCSGNEDSAFNYLRDYRIKVQARYPFVVANDKKITINGSSYESGTIFTSFKERPAMEFNTNLENKIIENNGK